MSSSEPQVIVIDGEEEIKLDSDGMEIRSEDEEPTQSDLDFIAPDDEVEAEVLLSQTVCEELDAEIENEVEDLGGVPPVPPMRLTRQSTVTAYIRDVDGPDGDDEDSDDEDYVPDEDSGDDGDDDLFSDDDEV